MSDIKIISDELFVQQFHDLCGSVAYEDNEARVLDALQFYLHGARSIEDVIEDLWQINYDECFDDIYRYLPQSAIDKTMEHLKMFDIYGCDDIFTMKI